MFYAIGLDGCLGLVNARFDLIFGLIWRFFIILVFEDQGTGFSAWIQMDYEPHSR